ARVLRTPINDSPSARPTFTFAHLSWRDDDVSCCFPLNWVEDDWSRSLSPTGRKQRQAPMHGFIVTWDVDSANAAMCGKIRRFVFGLPPRGNRSGFDTSRKSGRAYHYAGL